MIIFIILFIWIVPPFILFCLEFAECFIFLKQYKTNSIRIKDVIYRMFKKDRIFTEILTFSFLPFVGVLMLLVSIPMYYSKLSKFCSKIGRKLYLIISYPFKIIKRICILICEFIGNIKIG